MTEFTNNYDLPISGNVDDIRVIRYHLEWRVDFSEKSINGRVVTVLQHQRCCCSEKTLLKSVEEFVAIFDCCDITIHSIQEYREEVSGLFDNTDIAYELDNYSLKIRKRKIICPCQFPTNLRIAYSTRFPNRSLHWSRDQDDNPCVYTAGSFVNNRACFPCQEPPESCSLWSYCITVPENYKVVAHHNVTDEIVKKENDVWIYSSKSDTPLPACCFVFAVGKWVTKVLAVENIANRFVNINLISPPSLVDGMANNIANYAPRCFASAIDLIGNYPFHKCDFIVMPSAWANIGFASPSVIFISESLNVKPGIDPTFSMNLHIAHELSHTWFGILIGCKNWDEDWLTEGLATFLEDYIHLKALNINDSVEINKFLSVRRLIKWNNFIEEHNVDSELSNLKLTTSSKSMCGSVLANGQNPLKRLTKIHYTKSYFLFEHFKILFGQNELLECLKMFVEKYSGKLILAQDLFNFISTYFNSFQMVNETVLDFFDSKNPIPQCLNGFIEKKNLKTELTEVLVHINHWKKCQWYLARKKHWNNSLNEALFGDYLLVYLQELKSSGRFCVSVLQQIRFFYSIPDQNAEIQHQWCEIVLKNKCTKFVNDVETFLLKHRCMGVYLYGELLITEIEQFQQVAFKCYEMLKDSMDPDVGVVMRSMLFPQ